MKSNTWPSLLALFTLAVLCTAGVFAQQTTLRGVVIDSDTREPLPLVNIYLRGTTQGTTTDDEGQFSLFLPSDTKLVVSFSYIGYKKSAYEVSAPAGEAFDVTVELEPDAVQMDEVVVTGRKVREEQTASFVVTEKQIESYSATNLHDVLRRFTPDVYLTHRAISAIRVQSGFTLYVNDLPWDAAYIDAIDVYSIKRILVWRDEWAPPWFRVNSGSYYVVQVITR